jgi:hypothetical protein
MDINSIEPEDYYNAPISIEDAASMFRRKVQKNEPPYLSETTKLNNKKIEDWKSVVLQKICNDSGTIPAGRVLKSWELYSEGKVIEKYIEMKKSGMMLEYPPAIIEYWKDFFENLTIEELYSYGPGVLSAGWYIIQSYIKTWFAEEKWNRLFSHSSDPLYWEKNFGPHVDYLEGKILPFWSIELFKEITEKVGSVLSNQVSSDYGVRR